MFKVADMYIKREDEEFKVEDMCIKRQNEVVR